MMAVIGHPAVEDPCITRCDSGACFASYLK